MSVVIELMINHDDGDGVPAVKGNKYRDYINVLRLISPLCSIGVARYVSGR